MNQLFTVHPKGSNIHILVWTANRELAKEAAVKRWLDANGWGGPDNWDVIPITAPGDRVFLDGIVLSA